MEASERSWRREEEGRGGVVESGPRGLDEEEETMAGRRGLAGLDVVNCRATACWSGGSCSSSSHDDISGERFMEMRRGKDVAPWCILRVDNSPRNGGRGYVSTAADRHSHRIPGRRRWTWTWKQGRYFLEVKKWLLVMYVSLAMLLASSPIIVTANGTVPPPPPPQSPPSLPPPPSPAVPLQGDEGGSETTLPSSFDEETATDFIDVRLRDGRVKMFDACELELEYEVDRTGGGGEEDRDFRADIKLVNNKDGPVNSYQVLFLLPPNNTLIEKTVEGGVTIPPTSLEDGIVRVVNDPNVTFEEISVGDEKRLFSFEGSVTSGPNRVYALEGVSVNGIKCQQFPICEPDLKSEETGIDLYRLVRCIKPSCPRWPLRQNPRNGVLPLTNLPNGVSNNDNGNNANVGIDALPTPLAPGSDCMVQYCCGQQQSPTPPAPSPPPLEYVTSAVIYRDALAPDWFNVSTNGTYDFENVENVLDGEGASIKAAMERGGRFEICSEQLIGRNIGGDEGIQFYIYGPAEIGTLEFEFITPKAEEEDESQAPSSSSSTAGTSSGSSPTTTEEGEDLSRVLSSITTLSEDAWNMVTLDLPLIQDIECIALNDRLRLGPTFYLDDIDLLRRAVVPLQPPPPPTSATTATSGAGATESSSRAGGGVGGIGDDNGASSAVEASNTSSNQNSESSSCGPGCIAGIVVGIVVGSLIAFVLLAFLVMRRRKRHKAEKKSTGSPLDTLHLQLSPKGRTSSTASIGLLSPATGVMDVDFESDVELTELIGSGGFGSVYKGKWKGDDVAIKLMYGVFDESNRKDLENFAQEVIVLSRLNHPHIIEFLGACTKFPNICIVEELASESLYAHLHKDGGNNPLPYPKILTLAAQITDALCYLHPSVVHRDLKSQNVLLDSKGNAKVCDFGIAKFKDKTYLTTKNVQAGTPAYMAPELFRAKEASEKVDVFSFGILLWECLTGHVPWSDMSPLQVIFAVTCEKKRLSVPLTAPTFLKDLLTECWLENPEERPAFDDIEIRIESERENMTQNANNNNNNSNNRVSSTGHGVVEEPEHHDTVISIPEQGGGSVEGQAARGLEIDGGGGDVTITSDSNENNDEENSDTSNTREQYHDSLRTLGAVDAGQDLLLTSFYDAEDSNV